MRNNHPDIKMKDFDIEKLERKNVYTIPDDFFPKMQEHILNETARKAVPVISLSEHKVMRNRWWYAAAATIALIFGVIFFFNNEKSAVPAENETFTKKEKAIESQNQFTEGNVKAGESEFSKYSVADNNLKNGKVYLTKNENNNQTYRNGATETYSTMASTPKARVSKVSEAQVTEEIINSLSKEEVADITNSSENDVYLDLYY